MKTIEVCALFEVRFRKQLTNEQFAKLKDGSADIDEFVDESDAYRAAATEGVCELDWDYVRDAKPKKAAR